MESKMTKEEIKSIIKDEMRMILFKRDLRHFIRSLEAARAERDETYTVMMTYQEEQDLVDALSDDIKDNIEHFISLYHEKHERDKKMINEETRH